MYRTPPPCPPPQRGRVRRPLVGEGKGVRYLGWAQGIAHGFTTLLGSATAPVAASICQSLLSLDSATYSHLPSALIRMVSGCQGPRKRARTLSVAVSMATTPTFAKV